MQMQDEVEIVYFCAPQWQKRDAGIGTPAVLTGNAARANLGIQALPRFIFANHSRCIGPSQMVIGFTGSTTRLMAASCHRIAVVLSTAISSPILAKLVLWM